MSEKEPASQQPANPPPPTLSEDIQQGAPKDIASARPDELAFDDEVNTLEVGALKLQNDSLKQQVKEARDLHDLRTTYTRKLFRLIVAWLIVVIIYVGLSATPVGFKLSDSVLIAFITSTTVSVLGLFVLVAKWLFQPSHKDESK
jgi:hypothetical protein